MEFIQEISLELNSNTAYTTIGAKQGDADTRVVKVHLTQNGEDYPIPEGVSAYFRFRKPDGKAIVNRVSINDNTISLTFSKQTLAVAGRGYGDITLQSGTEILSSVSFILIIMASPSVADEITSSSEFGLLTEVVADAQNTIYEAEAWASGTRGGNPIIETTFFTPSFVSPEGVIISVSVVEAVFFEKVKHEAGVQRNFTFTYESAEGAAGAWRLVSETYNGSTYSRSDPVLIGDISSYGISYETLNGVYPNNNDEIIVSLSEKDNAYENNAKYYALQAAASKSSIDNLTIIAHSIPNETPATVSKTTVDDHLQFDFGIPKGDTGNVNFMTFEIDVSANSPTYGEVLMYRPTEVPDQINFTIIKSGENEGYLGLLIDTEVVTNA